MSRMVPTLEAEFGACVWKAKGGTGEIVELDKRRAPTAMILQQILATMLAKELTLFWPAGLTGEEWKKTPVKLTLSIIVERKDFKCYGK